jgi:hypothetical protein
VKKTFVLPVASDSHAVAPEYSSQIRQNIPAGIGLTRMPLVTVCKQDISIRNIIRTAAPNRFRFEAERLPFSTG